VLPNSSKPPYPLQAMQRLFSSSSTTSSTTVLGLDSSSAMPLRSCRLGSVQRYVVISTSRDESKLTNIPKGLTLMFFCVDASLFFNSYVNPIALDKINWKYYIVYDVWLAFELLIVYLFWVETRNTPLEEIVKFFDGDEALLGGHLATEKAKELLVEEGGSDETPHTPPVIGNEGTAGNTPPVVGDEGSSETSVPVAPVQAKEL
jgi:hypothetical protein